MTFQKFKRTYQVVEKPKGELEKKFLKLVADYKSITGISDRQLSHQLGKSYTFISQVKSGFTGIKFEVYEQMSKTLNKLGQETLTISSENGSHRVPEHRFTQIGDYYKVPIRFINIKAYGSFVDFFHTGSDEFFEWREFIVPRNGFIWYDDGYAIEIAGNSMAPRYTQESVVRITPVIGSNWGESLGVHVIVHKKNVYVKRIIKNNLAKDGTLDLHSDNEAEGSFTVRIEDIVTLWKVRDLLYSPPER